MAARQLSPTDVLEAIDAVSAGGAVDFDALRAAIRARADQLGALAADPLLDVAQADDARMVGAFIEGHLRVVDVLEAEGARAATVAWLDALTAGFAGD